MRIWHQSFIVLEDVPAYTDRVRQHVDRVKRPDTVVDLHGPVPGTYSTEYPGVDLGYSFLFGMHSLQWPATALTAQREGYDAFAMCTIIDPIYREIKTIVDIPVVAAGEVCFHVASMHGQRFGLMLFMDRVIPRYQQLIDWSGLTGRCAGIRQSGLQFSDVTKGFDKPGPGDRQVPRSRARHDRGRRRRHHPGRDSDERAAGVRGHQSRRRRADDRLSRRDDEDDRDDGRPQSLNGVGP